MVKSSLAFYRLHYSHANHKWCAILYACLMSICLFRCCCLVFSLVAFQSTAPFMFDRICAHLIVNHFHFLKVFNQIWCNNLINFAVNQVLVCLINRGNSYTHELSIAWDANGMQLIPVNRCLSRIEINSLWIFHEIYSLY